MSAALVNTARPKSDLPQGGLLTTFRNVPTDQSGSRFLRLPAELLMEILKMLLSHHNSRYPIPDVYLNRSSPDSSLSCEYIRYSGMGPNVLATCQHIHRLGIAVLYNDKTIEIEVIRRWGRGNSPYRIPGLDMDMTCDIVDVDSDYCIPFPLQSGAFKHVRDISLYLRAFNYMDAEQYFGGLIQVIRALRKLLNGKTVEIHLGTKISWRSDVETITAIKKSMMAFQLLRCSSIKFKIDGPITGVDMESLKTIIEGPTEAVDLWLMRDRALKYFRTIRRRLFPSQTAPSCQEFKRHIAMMNEAADKWDKELFLVLRDYLMKIADEKRNALDALRDQVFVDGPSEEPGQYE